VVWGANVVWGADVIFAQLASQAESMAVIHGDK